MKKIIFDFKKKKKKKDFYNKLSEKVDLPTYFGNNLDALWDVITSEEIDLPVEIVFVNFNKNKNKFFSSLEKLFTDAEKEMNKRLIFKICDEEK